MKNTSKTKLSITADEKEILPELRAVRVPTDQPLAYVTLSVKGGLSALQREDRGAAELVASLMDKGTSKTSKEDFQMRFEERGASLNFSLSPYFFEVTLSCLSKDLLRLIPYVFEALNDPLFDDSEITLEKERASSDIKEKSNDPNWVANLAFLKESFEENHPLSSLDAEETLLSIKNATRDDLFLIHEKILSGKEMNVVIGGGIKKEDFLLFGDAIKRAIPGKIEKYDFKKEVVYKTKKRLLSPIKDKASVTLVMGHPIEIDHRDPDFLPLYLGVVALGSRSFASKLLSEIREKRGLTYGIHAALQGGFLASGNGYFVIKGTFAPELFKKGEALAVDIVLKWVKKGLTAKELDYWKEYCLGSYKVDLISTESLVRAFTENARKDRPINFINDFPEIISSITLKEVNSAIKKHIDPKHFTVSLAGEVDEKK